jgi:hypothetical protein
MAARRLVIVMLVLLCVSTLAAALVPAPESDETPAGGTDTVSEEPARGGGATGVETDAAEARVLRRRVRVGSERPPLIRVRPGDELRLSVSGRVGQEISIPAFGLVETLAPYAPAQFDLIVDREGTFPVRAEGSSHPIARIRSAPARRSARIRPRAPRERSRPRGGAPDGRRGG